MGSSISRCPCSKRRSDRSEGPPGSDGLRSRGQMPRLLAAPLVSACEERFRRHSAAIDVVSLRSEISAVGDDGSAPVRGSLGCALSTSRHSPVWNSSTTTTHPLAEVAHYGEPETVLRGHRRGVALAVTSWATRRPSPGIFANGPREPRESGDSDHLSRHQSGISLTSEVISTRPAFKTSFDGVLGIRAEDSARELLDRPGTARILAERACARSRGPERLAQGVVNARCPL
jgi:hypothetical protein